MRDWENAVNQFLENWIDREDVIGALICGSYITGGPSERSDLDIHILLSEQAASRERGNLYIDDYLIEYFANPPQQIRAYFAENYKNHSTMSMVQFVTGKIVFDELGIVTQLKQEAQRWISKPYKDLSVEQIELKKYHLWDCFDNLLDCYENERIDFDFVYNHSLSVLFHEYCNMLNLERIPFYQISRYLTDPDYLRKYLKPAFPDRLFGNLFLSALTIKDDRVKIEHFELMLNHIFAQTGDFQIDGWRVRSPLDI